MLKSLFAILFALVLSQASWAQYHMPDAGSLITLDDGTKVFLISEIGEGGNGRVFRASLDPLSEETFALKFLNPSALTNDLTKKTIAAGIANAATLNPQFFLVPTPLRWQGVDIYKQPVGIVGHRGIKGLADRSYLSPEEATALVEKVWALFTHIAGGLRDLHTKGLVHADLKPSNMLIHEGRWKLIDLDGVTKPGSQHFMFTGVYAPPEQRTQQKVSSTTDLYAFGVSLGELLLGSKNPSSILTRETWALEIQDLAQAKFEKVTPEARAHLETMLEFVQESLNIKPEIRVTALDLLFPNGPQRACRRVYKN